MDLKIDLYKNCIPTLKTVVINNSSKDLSEQISLVAIATNAPIVACCFLYEQIYGSSPELEIIKERLIKFYKYDKII